MKRYWLIITVLIGLQGQPLRVHAQTNDTCITSDWPVNWSIVHGTFDYVNGFFVSVVTTVSGIEQQIASIEYHFDAPVTIDSMPIDWFFPSPLPDGYPVKLDVYLIKDGVVLRKLTYNHGILDWQTDTVTSATTGGVIPIDKIRIDVSHPTAGTNGTLPLGVRVLCPSGRLVQTPTPSPTLAIETPTPTSSLTLTPTAQTFTPVPSATASSTTAPSPTITPGGPTLTPGPTDTPKGVAAGGDIFVPPPPPKACGDIYNPCGALPFPPPKFSTVALLSPTYIPSVSPGPGFATTTPGAGTGTAPPGTGTPNATAVVGGITDFATQVGGMQASLLTTPVGIYGPDGQLADIPNAANEIGSHIGEFWGIVRGIQALFLGRAGTLIAFLLLCAAYIVLVKLITFIVPVFLAVLRWIFRMATIVAGALP